jgi:hypothetical protein
MKTEKAYPTSDDNDDNLNTACFRNPSGILEVCSSGAKSHTGDESMSVKRVHIQIFQPNLQMFNMSPFGDSTDVYSLTCSHPPVCDFAPELQTSEIPEGFIIHPVYIYMHILDAYSGNVSAVDALKPTASCGILL